MNVRDLDEIHILKFRPLSVSVLGSLKSMVFLLNNGRLVLGILINDYLRWLKCSSTHDPQSKNDEPNRSWSERWAPSPSPTSMVFLITSPGGLTRAGSSVTEYRVCHFWLPGKAARV